jgi:hypothetical protein
VISPLALLAAALAMVPPYQIDSVRFRFTHYDQDGRGYQSRAGPAGQPGSERLMVEQPQAEVLARLGDRITQRVWVPIDVVTAASPDHSRYNKPIDAPDAVTTSSRVNVAGALDTLTNYRYDAVTDLQFRATFHVEEPFDSWAFGVGFARSLAEDNTVVAASLNQVVDWFDHFDLRGRRHGRSNRSTSNLNLSLTQVLSPTTIAALSYGVTLQLGTLGNTWQSVLLADGTRGEEVYPRVRDRHALAARLAQWLPWQGALKLYARAYLDDWGIGALTGEAELVQRAGPWLHFRANYRYHRQTAARFFTIAADPDEMPPGPRTSDSDLAAFNATTLGISVAASLPPIALGSLRNIHLDLGYERYVRSNNLDVDITTCGLGFSF